MAECEAVSVQELSSEKDSGPVIALARGEVAGPLSIDERRCPALRAVHSTYTIVEIRYEE